MKNAYLHLIIIALFYVSPCTNHAQQNGYVQGEIIVRFESEVLDSTFLLSSQRNTLTLVRLYGIPRLIRLCG